MEFGFYNMDCMEGLKEFPDKYFDLAIVDPPYGDGLHAENGGGRGWFTKYNQKYAAEHSLTQSDRELGCHFNYRGRSAKYAKDNSKPVQRTGGDGGGWRNSLYGNRIIEWDTAPDQAYFDELFRVSRNQIIWGGNYFYLPPTRCFLVWRKLSISENFTMAMAEYAWTSFNSNAKVFEKAPQNEARFHPTQKPVELYLWCLKHFAKPGDKILDTHVGSGSSLVACEKAGFQYVGFEIDKEYYGKAKARIDTEKAQMNIFGFFGDGDKGE